MPVYRIQLVCEEGPEPLSGKILDHAEETLTVEAPTLWEGRSRAVSRMTISPMGRLLRAYDAESGREIVHPPPADLRPARFEIDGLPGVYSGYTRDESWNGFAVPYFELTEARRIAEDFAAQPPGLDGETRAEYDEGRDLIRLYEPSTEEWDEYGPVQIGIRLLYAIGTRIWTWQEVEG